MEKLSIIIPCYNAEPYIGELLMCLEPQITDDVEVIVVDDGSKEPFKTEYEWVKLYRQSNQGASVARNKGLDVAKGEYIAFIDADDLVSEKYIETILAKILTEKFDYCYLSWKTLPGGWHCNVKLNTIEDKFPPFNLCVWNRIYKKSMIGNVRFNPLKKIAEDAEFIREVKENGKKKAFISNYMYFYRSGAEDSLTKRFANGQLDTKRIVYHYSHVTKHMTHLIEEFKEADKVAEVILMTKQNDIPELENYAMVMTPTDIKGTELRGEPTKYFTKISKPLETQVVIYTSKTMAIGGIETFVYSFCNQMRKHYDILVLYDTIDEIQLERLEKIVRCKQNVLKEPIKCDTLIVNRITDKIPANISYKQSVQMVHGCKQQNWKVPTDRDKMVAVSKVVKSSFDECKDAVVINNLVEHEKPKKLLKLISATRLDTWEKGKGRMIALAEMLKANDIPFMWLYFSNREISSDRNLIRMEPTLDLASYIAEADYMVQLSDTEAFCYSIVEALQLGVPVITTPLPVLKELKFKDKEMGYVLPFDYNKWTNEDIRQLTEIPEFKYTWNNTPIVSKWRKVLGNTTPKGDYDLNKYMKNIEVTHKYFDVCLNREVKVGEILRMRETRALKIISLGYGKEVTDDEKTD